MMKKPTIKVYAVSLLVLFETMFPSAFMKAMRKPNSRFRPVADSTYIADSVRKGLEALMAVKPETDLK
jgi:hypothetical protein